MDRASCASSPTPTAHIRDAGVTLTEVLVTIFILAVGLLALLALFPLGALSMAQAIKDDRTAAFADDAAVFAIDGQRLLDDTAHFVEDSLLQGVVSPAAAAALRDQYEFFLDQADDLELRLEELRTLFPPQLIQPHAGPLLAQIHAIKARLKPIVRLLSVVERLACLKSPC